MLFRFETRATQMWLELKLEAKFRTFLLPVKIMGGMGEMSESAFRLRLGPNFWHTFDGAATVCDIKGQVKIKKG